MARPVQEKSVENATAATTGTPLETGSRTVLCLFVTATALDTANDTVEVHLEASQDGGNNWAKIRNETGTVVMQVTASEFDDPDGNGDFAAFVYANHVTADEIRANLVSITDSAGSDLQVTAYVGAYSSDSAQRFRTV